MGFVSEDSLLSTASGSSSEKEAFSVSWNRESASKDMYQLLVTYDLQVISCELYSFRVRKERLQLLELATTVALTGDLMSLTNHNYLGTVVDGALFPSSTAVNILLSWSAVVSGGGGEGLVWEFTLLTLEGDMRCVMSQETQVRWFDQRNRKRQTEMVEFLSRSTRWQTLKLHNTEQRAACPVSCCVCED
ncbi:hypothetical protein SRHO_G00188090 [Serrasalmus rhombeus]